MRAEKGGENRVNPVVSITRNGHQRSGRPLKVEKSEKRLHSMVHALCAIAQAGEIDAAVLTLSTLLDCAVNLRRTYMLPGAVRCITP